jgi:hypothetical protein
VFFVSIPKLATVIIDTRKTKKRSALPPSKTVKALSFLSFSSFHLRGQITLSENIKKVFHPSSTDMRGVDHDC